MRYNSVFLLNFYYPESGQGAKLFYPPLGIGYLSEYLETRGVKTCVLDMGSGKDMSKAEDLMSQIIEQSKPELIGLSLNAINFKRSMEILSNIHKKYPDIPIIVGGPTASSKGTELLKNYDFLSYAVVREGEKPLHQLCAGEKLENIGGLCWRNGQDLRQNPDKPSDDLSEFPFPRYAKFDLDSYGNTNAIGILTSRACPYMCIFCQQSALLGKKWRSRTEEGVIEEISYWKGKGKKEIHILDDNFALDRKRVASLSRLIIENGLNDLRYVLVGGLRIDQANEEVLLSLKQMGVQRIAFGVESGSDKILKFIKKGITAKMADEAIALAVSMGFEVKLFFILGFPTETMEDIKQSFDLALKYPIAQARFFNLIPYTDTYLMDWLKKNNARFLYSEDEYMNDYERFQRIPIFDYLGGMNYEEKLEALKKADEVIKIIEDRNNQHGK